MFGSRGRSARMKLPDEEVLRLMQAGPYAGAEPGWAPGVAPQPDAGFSPTPSWLPPTPSPMSMLPGSSTPKVNAGMEAPGSLPDPTSPGSRGSANRPLDQAFPTGEYGARPLADANPLAPTLRAGGMSDEDIVAGDPQASAILNMSGNAIAGRPSNLRTGMFGGRSVSDMVADRRSFLSDAQLAAPVKVKKAWDDVGGGRDKLQSIAAALMAAGGDNAGAQQLMAQVFGRQREAKQREWDKEDYERRRADTQADRDYEANKPQFFSGSEDRVRFDPVTGQSTKLYDAPSPAETYAQGMGYAPGSDEYRTAMQDYTLRGWGDTAMSNRLAQDQFRQRGRESLEAQRFGNRQQLRSAPTYRDLHPRPAAARGGGGGSATMAGVIAPILAKVAQGQPLSAGEQQAYQMYRGGGRSRGGGGAGGPPAAVGNEGRVAVGPDGRRYRMVNGQMVPLG